MMTIVELSIICLAGMFLVQLLKRDAGGFGVAISLMICILLSITQISEMGHIFELIQKTERLCGDYVPYLSVLIKMVGITFISDFTIAICKDAGLSAVAGCLETVTRIILCLAGLPIIETAIAMISSLK